MELRGAVAISQNGRWHEIRRALLVPVTGEGNAASPKRSVGWLDETGTGAVATWFLERLRWAEAASCVVNGSSQPPRIASHLISFQRCTAESFARFFKNSWHVLACGSSCSCGFGLLGPVAVGGMVACDPRPQSVPRNPGLPFFWRRHVRFLFTLGTFGISSAFGKETDHTRVVGRTFSKTQS